MKTSTGRSPGTRLGSPALKAFGTPLSLTSLSQLFSSVLGSLGGLLFGSGLVDLWRVGAIGREGTGSTWRGGRGVWGTHCQSLGHTSDPVHEINSDCPASAREELIDAGEPQFAPRNRRPYEFSYWTWGGDVLSARTFRYPRSRANRRRSVNVSDRRLRHINMRLTGPGGAGVFCARCCPLAAVLAVAGMMWSADIWGVPIGGQVGVVLGGSGGGGV